MSDESTFCSNKTKLAPRSSLQFKVGPQFIPTVVKNPIFTSNNKELIPIITPRIDRGFEKIGDEWIGYKRNYFTLVCAFHFQNQTYQNFFSDNYHVIDKGKSVQIKYFALRLISKSADDNSLVSLVQHTAKRDRGPQNSPSDFAAIPSDLPNHEVIRNSANVRNSNKIAKLDQLFYFDNSISNYPALKSYPIDSKITKVARYERIQFSSSINYKKPSSNNKKFKLSVELIGNIGDSNFITLAYTETPPLIVRGRSPSNYESPVDIKTPPNIHQEILDSASCSIEELPLPPKTKKKLKKESLSLNDEDTYEILLNANKQLDGLTQIIATSTPTLNKKKSSSSSSNFNNGNDLLKNSIMRKIKKPKIIQLVDSPTVKNNKVEFPSPSDFELDNFDFDSSIGDVELIDSRAKKTLLKINSFKKENLSTIEHENDHDLELLKIKSRVEIIQNDSDHLIEYFSRIQHSNPSEILSNDFDDGPSFIVY